MEEEKGKNKRAKAVEQIGEVVEEDECCVVKTREVIDKTGEVACKDKAVGEQVR